ncbi:MAG TPA: hypothetical protein VL175_06860 [Pirellulales bacterium]|jgi:hypothetical protein|nr:hypothetical protein [Pirellulales bacterium]
MSVQRAAWGWLVLATIFLAGPVRQAAAMPPFFKEFQTKYVKADSADEKDKAFATLVTQTAKCNVCHMPGPDKKARNAYGKQLATILKKENFKADRLKAEAEKCTAEIMAALEAVAAMKSGDDTSPTFGELIGQGKLPGGDAKAVAAAAPAPATPAPAAPAATPAPAAATPTPEVQDAIGKIQKIGGTVMPLAMNDDSLVVDFHLGGTALNDEGLALVKTLPKLVQLDLKDTQISDAGLANLAAIATLNRLHLEKTKVTDAGLAHLKDLGNLEYLNVYGTAVTDAGLEHLKGLKNLKKLYVWQTPVTDAGIAKLKESLPGVTVVK